MTVQSPTRPRSEGSDGGDPEARRRRARRRVGPPAAKRWRWVYPVVLLALAVGAAVLSVAGAELILDSRDGQIARSQLDPTAPGYLAAVSPTPTLLAVHEDDDGNLVSAVVLTMGPDDIGGGVAVLPPEMFVQLDPDEPGVSLAAVYDEFGVEDLETGQGLRAAVSTLFGADVDTVLSVDAASLTRLIEPLAPLEYSLADPVRTTSGGKTVSLLPAGPVAIDTTDDIVAATEILGPKEDPVRRAERVQRFWHAWIEKLRATPDPAAGFPLGSADTQLARFLRGLAAGSARVDLVPYGQYLGLLVPQADELPRFVQQLVPYPRQAGVRTSVAVYNGVGDLELNKSMSRDLVAAGAQILWVGNTDSFEVDETTVVYHQPGARDRAEALADAIGVTEVRFEEKAESDLEVTVTIGRDYHA